MSEEKVAYKVEREKTYGDIIKEFKTKTGITSENILNVRPCAKPYFEISIPNAILVWLKDGGRIIYISE